MARRTLTIRSPGVPKLPKLPTLGAPRRKKKLPVGAEKRRIKRISLKELNVEGAELLRTKLPEIKKIKDRRPGYMKVLDVLDLPRNVVANAIGSLVGVKKRKLEKATLGLPRVHMSDVLKKLGVRNKVVAGVMGFAADVAIDPLLYLSLGATTGVSIGKHLPKILKPGWQAMRRMAPKLVRGKGVGPKITAAVLGRSAARIAAPPKIGKLITRRVLAKQLRRPEQTAGEAMRAARAMLKVTPAHQMVLKAEKLAERALIGRRGGLLPSMLAKGAFPKAAATPQAMARIQAARKFITRFGEKGRTILRAPFAAKGIALPFGKRAALARRFAETAAGKNLDYLIRTATKLESAALSAVKNTIALGQNKKATAELGSLVARQRETVQALRTARKAGRIPGRIERPIAFRTPAMRKAERRLDVLTGIKEGLEAESLPTGVALREFRAKGIEVTPEARAIIQRISAPAKRKQIVQIKQRIAEVKAEFKAVEKAAPRIQTFRTSKEAMLHGAVQRAKAETRRVGPVLRARAKEAIKTAKEAGGEEAAARVAAEALRTSPMAPLPMRLAAEQEMGRIALKDVPADATKAQRMLHSLRRFKEQLFGPGASFMHQREVGIAQQITMGKAIAGLRTHRRFSELTKPVVERMAAVLNTNTDDAMARLIDVLETGGTKGLGGYHLADPIRQSVSDTLQRITVAQPDLLADIDRVAGEVRPFLDEIQALLTKMRVSPGKIDYYIPRPAAEEFRKVSPANIKRIMGGKAWTAPRVQLIEYQRTGYPISQILSTNQKEIVKMNALIATGDARKIATYKISARWWNTPQSRSWGRNLAPKEFVGPQFATDIGEIMGSAAEQAELRLGAGQLRDMVAKTGARLTPQQLRTDPIFRHYARETMDKDSPLYQTVLRGLRGMSFPKPVTDMLNRATYVSRRPEAVNNVLRWSDSYLNIWKSVTLMHPAYTIRNVFQNLLGGSFQGAMPRAVVGNSVELYPLVKAALDGKSVTGMINIAGVPVRASVFINDARIWNQLSSGMMSMAMTASKFERAKTMIGRLGRQWYRFNNEIESTMKVAIFKTFLDDGLSVRQAAMKTILAMPDLTDLSRLEREVGRRVFPWISWMRRNTALQLFHYLPKKPIFAATGERFRHALEQAFSGDDVVDRQVRPEWMEDMQAAQIAGDKEEGQVFMLANWLPFDDMIKIFTGPFDPQAAIRSVLEQMRPEAKFMAEMGIGVDIFRRRALPKFTLAEYASRAPWAVVGRSRTPLDSLLGVRPLREAFRVAEMPGVAAGVTRMALGGAFQPISRARGLRAEAVRLREELAKARYGINRARQVNDMQLAQTLTIRWMQILRRMQQMGLPGVPKATGALLEQAGIAAGSGLRGSP